MMNSTLNLASILIVDDNPTNLAVLAQALKRAGLSIRIETSGERAIQQIQQKSPDLVLLDVQMPGIDGFETCRQLKANPDTQDIPVIFMTALGDSESKTKGLSLGAVDYITKPFEQEEVLARVGIHLRLRQLTNRLEQLVEERTASLQKAQVQLVQQEKLATLGQLIAGIAHEMNNPIGCIVSNIAPAYDYLADLTQTIRFYQQHCPCLPDQLEQIADIDIEFVLDDMPKLLNSMKLSVDRIKEISLSLRNFARSDTTTKVAADLHEGLDSTLLILRHRLKANGNRPAIEVIKDYGDLPKVNCYPGQINQVFMNIVANAIDALEDAWGTEGYPKSPVIQIHTEASGDCVLIRIVDNGPGMTNDVKQHLFEPMFTTKSVGKGTGLGLSIVHQIVVEKHGGKLDCASTFGEGTEFKIEIPID